LWARWITPSIEKAPYPPSQGSRLQVRTAAVQIQQPVSRSTRTFAQNLSLSRFVISPPA